MSDKYERLVEEIANEFCDLCDWLDPIEKRCDVYLPSVSLQEAQKRCERLQHKIKATITLVSQAIADGDMDEWLAENMGLVGRAKKNPSKPVTWTVTVAELESVGATDFIAFCKGQEEEG